MRSGRATYGLPRRSELVLEPKPACVCGDDPCPVNCPNRIDREQAEIEETT